jgi:hypothetical protein
MSRRFQFSLRRILGVTALAALAGWLWSLRDEPGAAGDAAFYLSPIAAGAAVGQLFGRPLLGVVAVVMSLLFALNLVQVIDSADTESLTRYAIVIGAVISWPMTLAVIRRWNARRDS